MDNVPTKDCSPFSSGAILRAFYIAFLALLAVASIIATHISASQAIVFIASHISEPMPFALQMIINELRFPWLSIAIIACLIVPILVRLVSHNAHVLSLCKKLYLITILFMLLFSLVLHYQCSTFPLNTRQYIYSNNDALNQDELNRLCKDYEFIWFYCDACEREISDGRLLRILTKVNTCSHPKVNGIRSFATLCFD